MPGTTGTPVAVGVADRAELDEARAELDWPATSTALEVVSARRSVERCSIVGG